MARMENEPVQAPLAIDPELESMSSNCLTNYVDALQRQSFVRQLERRTAQRQSHEHASAEPEGISSS